MIYKFQEIEKNNQMEILKLKDAITETENIIHGFNSTLDTDEQRINEPRDRSM